MKHKSDKQIALILRESNFKSGFSWLRILILGGGERGENDFSENEIHIVLILFIVGIISVNKREMFNYFIVKKI